MLDRRVRCVKHTQVFSPHTGISLISFVQTISTLYNSTKLFQNNIGSSSKFPYQPRFEKSSNISLVVSTLLLNLIPKTLSCFELSYFTRYSGPPSTWLISGNPIWSLWEGSGEGEIELAASTIFFQREIHISIGWIFIFKDRKHVLQSCQLYAPIWSIYKNNWDIRTKLTWQRTASSDDPLTSSCFFFQCKYMA